MDENLRTLMQTTQIQNDLLVNDDVGMIESLITDLGNLSTKYTFKSVKNKVLWDHISDELIRLQDFITKGNKDG